MANQSRPRAAHNNSNIAFSKQGQASYEQGLIYEPFTYSSLDTSVDGIRLAILQPTHISSAMVYCRLVHVAFGEIPKYEALSYTWGSEVSKNAIVIDGRTFMVGNNLWGALFWLRHRLEERWLWIDAICINQADILERNQQLRIMPHIYARAQTVLVWLGTEDFVCAGYSKWDECFKQGAAGDDALGYDAFLDKLCTVDYWNRVWIIQEICKARKIEIHCGSKSVDWATFIYRIGQYGNQLANCVPLKLAKQMINKYGDGYKLENLLKTHRNALCKDPRDKIYGFTGLANDTHGRLPMDYGKTLFEVWKDVMRFRNSDNVEPQYDIVQFARFVQDLLGGPGIASVEELYNEKLSEDANPKAILLCPTLLWGRIAHVGPTPHEVLSNLQKMDEWTTRIKYVVRWPGAACEENDLFLQQLEELKDSDLDRIVHFHPSICFEAGGDIDKSMRITVNRVNSNIIKRRDGRTLINLVNRLLKKPAKNEQTIVKRLDSQSDHRKHLILLDHLCSKDHNQPGAFTGIGLAGSSAEVGDLICYFYQSDCGFYVRRHQDLTPNRGTLLTIEGTAVLAKANSARIWDKDGNSRLEFAVPTDSQALSQTIIMPLTFANVYQWAAYEIFS